jgi:hypothetical protein
MSPPHPHRSVKFCSQIVFYIVFVYIAVAAASVVVKTMAQESRRNLEM